MWADHHVLRAREALAGIAGVRNVAASARDLQVRVAFDASATDQAALLAVLTAAGYPPGEPPSQPPQEKDKPAWAVAPRVTTTDAVDLSMSGDYRQY